MPIRHNLSPLTFSSLKDDLPFHNGKRRRSFLRRLRLAIVPLVLVFMLLCWLSITHRPVSRASDWIPWSFRSTNQYPLTYDQIRQYERNLPQHVTSLPPPEGINGRTLKISNEVWGLGLNNQLNNRLVLSHLAYLSNRSYVFHDITFTSGGGWESAVWHPLNTFISGPTAGGAFPPFARSSPRAISKDYWIKICPEERRVVLDVDAINSELKLPDNPDGLVILERWAEKLTAMPETCVEISYMSSHIIDYHLFGSSRSLPLFPSLTTSPIISHFRWSDVVLHAVERNIPLITHTHVSETSHLSPPRTLPSHVGDASKVRQNDQTLSNVLALHIRRGDYGPHCKHMASYAAFYNSWNLLPSLPDVYNPPKDIIGGEAYDEFMRHCWPSVDDIVQRVRDVKRDYEATGRKLKSIYVLTNGKRPWVDKLTERLLTSRMGWERVTSSLDLTFISEPEQLANQAVDMEIARRAAVFVGNGFSTMTANILMFRLMNGMSAQTTRFW